MFFLKPFLNVDLNLSQDHFYILFSPPCHQEGTIVIMHCLHTINAHIEFA